VDLFYLLPEMRRSGVGSRVFTIAEEEAVRRGCVSGVLFTISFQAPGFYSRHGWREIARIPCLPAGTSRVVMSKILSRSNHASWSLLFNVAGSACTVARALRPVAPDYNSKPRRRL